ncbi:hypothetical protein Acsp02_40110 [Actinoplanes sp. NBRC 103695]|nr:hypothetical protein Acsp02_40110 [Actinoplanes sp. NBRC 103695]
MGRITTRADKGANPLPHTKLGNTGPHRQNMPDNVKPQHVRQPPRVEPLPGSDVIEGNTHSLSQNQNLPRSNLRHIPRLNSKHLRPTRRGQPHPSHPHDPIVEPILDKLND